MDSRGKTAIRVVWLTDLRCWLADHGVPGRETDRKPTEFLLDVYMQKCSWSNEQKSRLTIKKKDNGPSINSLTSVLSHFIDPEALEWRGRQMPLRKDPGSLSKIYIVNISPRPFLRDLEPFITVNVHWGNWYNQTLQELLDIANELKLIPNNPKHHLWVTHQNRLWRSDAQCSGPSQGSVDVQTHFVIIIPFLECIIRTDVPYSWPNTHIGFLTLMAGSSNGRP